CGILGIPVVSTVDTNGDFFSVTYPLLSNDDSYMFAFFYFSLFMNIYDLGRVERYRSTLMSSITVKMKNNWVQEYGKLLYLKKKKKIIYLKKIIYIKIYKFIKLFFFF